MHRSLDHRLALLATRCIVGAARQSSLVLVPALLATFAAGWVALDRLSIDTDTEAMLSPELPFRARQAAYREAFPALSRTLLVVLDGAAPENTRDAARRLRDEMARSPAHFDSVYLPDPAEVLPRHRLLFASQKDLDSLDGEVAAAAPLTRLLDEPVPLAAAIRGVLQPTSGTNDLADRLAGLLQPEASPVTDHSTGDDSGGNASPAPADVPREDVPLDDATPNSRQRGHAPPYVTERQNLPDLQTLMVRPTLDFHSLRSASSALEALDRAVDNVGLNEVPGLRVRATGDAALNTEEMSVVSRQAGLAAAASFGIVIVFLLAVVRSVRLVLVVAIALICGLVWTAAFAALAIGRLNLLSLAFAVLFVGLGVDFGIHFVMRFDELRSQGHGPMRSLRETGASVGSSLILCAITTAIGFYAFLPTEYAGVAELGLISGSGVFLALIATTGLTPALIRALGSTAKEPSRRPSLTVDFSPSSFPLRYPRTVIAFTALAVAAAALAIPSVAFDPDPIGVRDPDTESVRAFRDLETRSPNSPWTIDVLAANAREAEALARQLRALPEVGHVVHAGAFLPPDQEGKLERLASVRTIVEAIPYHPLLRDDAAAPPEAADAIRSALTEAVAALASATKTAQAGAQDAGKNPGASASFLGDLHARIENAGDPEAEALTVQREVFGPVVQRLRELAEQLPPGPAGPEDLPTGLLERFVSANGSYRLQIFPAPGTEQAALDTFFEAVTSVTDETTGPVVVMIESGLAVVEALQMALLLAVGIITLLLLVLWRSLLDTFLALVPLSLGILFTAATTVALAMPFNFANVIVLPLLLGIGVDSGIHLVHRYRSAPLGNSDLLHTSTARAVLFSALTTIASFASLGFASHQGIAGLGRLLTVGVSYTLAANLIVLPALLQWLSPRSQGQAATDNAMDRHAASPTPQEGM